MHIGMVGGLDRNEERYQAMAERAGHRFEHHTGHLAGRGAAALESLVERCDLVIVVTDVNSHGAMWRVRRVARRRGSSCLLMNRCGPSRFAALLAELANPDGRALLQQA